MRILDVDHSPKYGVWEIRVLNEYPNGAGQVFALTFVQIQGSAVCEPLEA